MIPTACQLCLFHCGSHRAEKGFFFFFFAVGNFFSEDLNGGGHPPYTAAAAAPAATTTEMSASSVKRCGENWRFGRVLKLIVEKRI